MTNTSDTVPSSYHPPKFKRKTLIVKRGMQAKFVLWVSVFVLVAVTAIGVDFYFHFGREVENFMDPSLYELFRTDSYVFLVKLALYMIGVTIFAIFASHRLAGPVYRIENSARILASGDLTHRVKLRKGDEFGDLQDEFNDMAESLHRLVSHDAHMTMRVSKQLNDILGGTKHLPEDVQEKLKTIKSDVDHLHKSFKI